MVGSLISWSKPFGEVTVSVYLITSDIFIIPIAGPSIKVSKRNR